MPDLGTSSPRSGHTRYMFAFSSGHRNWVILSMIGLLLSQVASSPTQEVKGSGSSSITLFAHRKTYGVQSAAATCAAVSMAASFVAFYWFCRMKKLFRHRLIMLLIFGDLMKASWLFFFAVVSIAKGTVFTESALCQASGFMVQYGTETSDYAVLAIAVHSALQVFRPSKSIRSDGLYPYRYFLYVGAILVPGLMSSLAFINPHWGYMSQGSFCSLPIRPFWYRLALAWIPRYLVAIIILGLAIAIYTHVGFEMRLHADMARQSASIKTGMLSDNGLEKGTGSEIPDMTEQQCTHPRRGSSVVSLFSASRHASLEASAGSHNEGNETVRSASVPSTQYQHRNSAYTISPQQTNDAYQNEKIFPRKASRDEDASSPLGPSPTNHIERRLTNQRARVHRQLRLMFIYPVFYILMWIFPFANHCMMYSNYLAAHPIYWLSLAATICITSMGAVDCLIFSLREQPWRHIPARDENGTFFASFMWWRRHIKTQTDSSAPVRPSHTLRRGVTESSPDTPHTNAVESRWISSLVRAGTSARRGGSSDQAKLQADIARSRLESEREERRLAQAGGLDTIESPGEEVDMSV